MCSPFVGNRAGNRAKCYYCDRPGHWQRDCRVMKRHQAEAAAQQEQPQAPRANKFNPYMRPQEVPQQQGAPAAYHQQQYNAAAYPPLHMQLMSHQPANPSGGGIAHQPGDATSAPTRKEVRFEGCAVDFVDQFECLNIEIDVDRHDAMRAVMMIYCHLRTLQAMMIAMKYRHWKTPRVMMIMMTHCHFRTLGVTLMRWMMSRH